MRSIRSQRGLSLIEMMIVLVVAGVMMSILIISVTNAMERSKQRAAMADLRTVARAIEAYGVDNNILPSDAGGLVDLVDDLVPSHTQVLPLEDPWDNQFVYAQDGLGNYTLASLGKDGIDGPDWDGWKHQDFIHDIVMYNGIFTAAPQ